MITRPMPSMPLRFWNDAGGSRHHDAYFPAYPAVRRHGDWVTTTQHGTVIVNSRPGLHPEPPGGSDRMGSAGGRRGVASAVYADDLRRTDDGWRISRRVIHLTWPHRFEEAADIAVSWSRWGT